MVIKTGVDIENLCTCREARERGKICAHGVAVGLHWLNVQKPQTASTSAGTRASTPIAKPAERKPSSLTRDPAGEPAELFIILPPNFDKRRAWQRCWCSRQNGRRSLPVECLAARPRVRASAQDNAVLDQLETLANGETSTQIATEISRRCPRCRPSQYHPRQTAKSRHQNALALPLGPPGTEEIVLALKDKISDAQ